MMHLRMSVRHFGNRVGCDVFDTPHRPRVRGDQAHPRLGDGCPAARQERPPGHGDGARSARPRAVQPGDAPPSRRSGVARPRPVRALQRPRLDPPVLDALPLRLRARARRPHGVPLVRVAHPGPPRGRPHAGHRGDHRPARPGLRQRRRDGDRRAGAARPLRRRRSSTTTPGRLPATAASWRASATRPRRSPATSASDGSTSCSTTTASRSTARPSSPPPTTSASASRPTAGTSSTSARSPTTAMPSRRRCSPPRRWRTARAC